MGEVFNALTEEMFRTEVGFGLSGKTNGQCPANWYKLGRSQRILRARGVQSGFTLLGSQQLSACAEDPGAAGEFHWWSCRHPQMGRL